jgi:hypothetical protein
VAIKNGNPTKPLVTVVIGLENGRKFETYMYMPDY